MQAIINEWQLGTTLNQALQQQHRADFALWLAVLSPAVQEMAAFYTPLPKSVEVNATLYQQLFVRQRRSFAWQETDAAVLAQLNRSAQTSLRQLKLQSALTPEPWVRKDDAKKLDGRLMSNLDQHAIRRLSGKEPPIQEGDETVLYEMLQELNANPLPL
ncbi:MULTISPECIES: VC2046/SO_2500 family protein [unclassified Alishewanella]|uniref:VC2046/SO_2500 family protein n=1 Tax=unclassified Alishewanella TaxID=2628974 RepID=UPI00404310E2